MPELEAQLRAYGSVLDRADAAIADVVDALPRFRRSFVVAIAAAVVVAIVASAFAVTASRSGSPRQPHIVTPTPSTTPGSTPTPKTTPGSVAGVLAIGDSVMEGAQGALQTQIPGIVVDAVKSRQFSEVIQVVKIYRTTNELPPVIVVHLGTNGRITSELFDQMMQAIGPGHTVYFLTARVPRLWESEVNSTLRAGAARWPNAVVVDWHEYANPHDDWFVADGFHLTAVGQRAYALFIAASIGRLPSTPTTTASTTSALDVVSTMNEPALPPWPLAVAGGDVWVAPKGDAGGGAVPLERRDPSTGKLLATIDVPQQSVLSIAGYGDTLWVAGGGDGGVPDTTVSRVDTRTAKVVFTKTLTGTPCSCPIVAGSAGVWLVGNGSQSAFHLSPLDGHVTGSVHFSNHLARAAMEVRARLVVGLDDGTANVIDPVHDRIERNIDFSATGDATLGEATAMSPAAIPAVGSDPAIDGLIVSTNTLAFALGANGWTADQFVATNFLPTTVAEVRGLVWVFGGDRLEVASTHAVVSNEFAWVGEQHRFERVSASPATQVQGFSDAVATGDTLWVVYNPGDGGQPTVVIVKAPETFPFR